MITRQEYNKALDVVKDFHKQLFNNITTKKNNFSMKTPILEWDKLGKCNQRLYNALHNLEKQNKENRLDIYIETITRESFKSIRNAGGVTWIEFKMLRDDKF